MEEGIVLLEWNRMGVPSGFGSHKTRSNDIGTIVLREEGLHRRYPQRFLISGA